MDLKLTQHHYSKLCCSKIHNFYLCVCVVSYSFVNHSVISLTENLCLVVWRELNSLQNQNMTIVKCWRQIKQEAV